MILSALRKFMQTDAAVEPLQDSELMPIAAAMLLLEVAWADHEVSEMETEALKRGLHNLFKLTPSAIDSIITRAHAHHEDSVGVYEYTRRLNDSLDADEKFELLTQLWRLAFADAELDRYEEHTLRRIAELLYVPHQRFIAAKRLARTTEN